MTNILFQTDRFNLTVEGEHFINPRCYGEDLGEWIRPQLIEYGIETHDLFQEDWGWELECTYEGNPYGIAMSVMDGSYEGNNSNYGEWMIFIIHHQSFWESLFGKKKATPPEEPIIKALLDILKKAEFDKLRTEED